MNRKKAPNGAGYIQGGYLGHQIDGVRIFDHVRIAEKALGKPLPPGAVVHHVNEVKTDNTPTNLVICPNRAYHNLIHARMAAMAATGDASKRKCRRCGEYDDLQSLREYLRPNASASYWHPACERAYSKQLYDQKKAQQ